MRHWALKAFPFKVFIYLEGKEGERESSPIEWLPPLMPTAVGLEGPKQGRQVFPVGLLCVEGQRQTQVPESVAATPQNAH